MLEISRSVISRISKQIAIVLLVYHFIPSKITELEHNLTVFKQLLWIQREHLNH